MTRNQDASLVATMTPTNQKGVIASLGAATLMRTRQSLANATAGSLQVDMILTAKTTTDVVSASLDLKDLIEATMSVALSASLEGRALTVNLTMIATKEQVAAIANLEPRDEALPVTRMMASTNVVVATARQDPKEKVQIVERTATLAQESTLDPRMIGMNESVAIASLDQKRILLTVVVTRTTESAFVTASLGQGARTPTRKKRTARGEVVASLGGRTLTVKRKIAKSLVRVELVERTLTVNRKVERSFVRADLVARILTVNRRPARSLVRTDLPARTLTVKMW